MFAPSNKSTPKATNIVNSLRMLIVVLFDGANISLVCYRLMVPKDAGPANHFDTKILFKHVTEESGPSVQSLRMPPVAFVQDPIEPSGTASKEQVLSCAASWSTLPAIKLSWGPVSL